MKTIRHILCAFLCLGMLASCKEEAKQTASRAPMSLKVAVAEAQDIYPTLDYVAKLEAKDEVELKARVEGFLEKRYFKEGYYVKKGEVLMEIEPVRFQAKVRQAEGDLIRANAGLKNAKVQYERAKNLYKTKNISESKLDDAEASYKTAEATVLQAKAQLELAKKDLEYTKIVSPMNGRIGVSNFSEGELIGPSSGVLATIVSVDPIYAVFSVSENGLLLMQDLIGEDLKNLSGIEVQFNWSNGREYPEIGKLTFIDTTLQEGMNTLQLRAEFPNSKNSLIPGQFGRVILTKKTPIKEIMIPQIALQQDMEGNYVLLVNAENKLEKKKVSSGLEMGSKVAVIGLNAGDKVLTEGFQRVVAGMEIVPEVVNEVVAEK